MARIGGKFIRGLMNDVVYREYRGQQILQSKPHTPKQHRTEGTEKAATVFGKASKLAAEIRVGLHHISTRFCDGKMNYRLSAEILHSLNSVKNTTTQTFDLKPDSFRSLVGFEFNLNSPLKNNLLVQPIISLNGTTLQIEIPELKIPIALKFPEDRLDRCKLIIVNTMIDLVQGRTHTPAPQIMDIPYSYTATLVPKQTFEFEVTPGCLCITAISLQYIKSSFAGDIVVNNKLFNPTAIIYSAIIEGTVNPSDTKSWGLHGYLSPGLQ